MRVTRLEIFGFKSFMERLILPLEGGVTGVVGPNGCGKSNIVDALRWVLGETRASNLRGETLEDVIFNGTDKLRPLGLAEVSITLRARNDNFFEDLMTPQAETELAALLEKVNFEPEPAAVAEVPAVENAEEGRKVAHLTVIHGSLSDRKQIVDSEEPVAAQDIAEGSPAESAEQIETKTEPVAPVAGDQPSHALLARFSWLKSANEVQITRRLYRSGESEFFINRVTCRLKDIKDLLRAVGLGPRSYTIVAQGEVSRVISAKPEERRLIIEEAAGVLGLRDRIAATLRRLDETTQNLIRLQDIITGVTRQVGSLKRQAARAEARAELKDRITTLDRTLFADKLIDFKVRIAQKEEALAKLKAEQEETQAKLAVAQAEEESARATLAGLDVKGDALRTEMDSIRQQLESRSRARMEKTSRLNVMQSSATAKGEEQGRLQERLTLLEQRSQDSQTEVKGLRERFDAISAELGTLEKGDDEALRIGAKNLADARESLRGKEQQLRVVRERASGLKGSLAEIEQQIIALSPLTQLQRTIGQSNSQELSRIRESTTLFADSLKVPEAYARAVQAVLAERAAFLLAEDPHKIAVEFVNGPLKDSRIRKAGLGLGVMKSGSSAVTSDAPAPIVADSLPSLLSLISIDEKAEIAATRIFSNILVAETLDQAITFFQTKEFGTAAEITIVTKEGEILTDSTFFSLPHEGGIIQFRNRAEQVRQQVEAHGIEQSAIEIDRDALQTHVSTAEEQHRAALQVSQDRQAQARRLSNEQGSARGRLDAGERLVQQISHDSAKIHEQIAATKLQIANAQQQCEVIKAELDAMVSDEEERQKAQLDSLTHEYAQLDPVRKESRQSLHRVSQTANETRSTLDRSRNIMSQSALDVQRLSLEIESLRERISTEYGHEVMIEVTTAAEHGTRLPSQEQTALSEELSRLKTKLVREGDVDPTSIEQYEVEKVRLDELVAQKTDLESAISTLQQTVQQLTAASQERFMATFNAVSENFSQLIPRLFGGGKGSLELTNPENPLESGVEIVARPPGKKLKSIEIMSGGEKALCATGLIFSMFLVRPSPLCVLDEIDAPLDDANLVRLLSLIKELSAQTQFLMITHNKQSMAVASNLVGVTMQQPGATRTISVSLQEAYKQVG